MLEDSRGYIWMGTQGGGLSRFDGKEFSATYTVRDGLLNNFVNCIAEGADGRLLIGTKTGISIYNGISFTTLPLTKDTTSIPVGAIVQDADGLYWLGTGWGVYTWDGSSIEYYSQDFPELQNNISTLFIDKKGVLWAGNDLGLHRLSEDEVKTFSRASGLSNRRIRSIDEDSQGRLWIGSYGGGLQWFDGKRFHTISSRYGRSSNIVNAILVDRDDRVWIATLKKGVYCWDGRDSTFIQYQPAQGLSNKHVRTLLQDRWGNLWFGTSGGGASKYYSQPFEHFNSENGMPGTYTYSVVKDHLQQLWMGLDDKGIARYDGQSFTLLNRDSGFVNAKVRALHHAHNNDLWLGTEGQGLWRYDGKRFYKLPVGTSEGGVRDTWIKCIKQASDSSIWIGTAAGGVTVFEIDGKSNIKRTKYLHSGNGLLPHDKVNALHEDRKGRMWFGTNAGGLAVYLGGDQIQVFDASNALPNNQVRSIVEDRFGYLWIGVADGGLVRLDLYQNFGETAIFSYADGLSSLNIYLLYADDEDIWVGTEKGIDRVMLDEQRNIAAVEPFGKAEGFIGIETCQNAVTKDDAGNLWFGTINGLTKYNPKNNQKDELAPIISFTNINLFYDPIKESEYAKYLVDWHALEAGLSLPYHQNHLGFEFIGIDHKNAAKVRYQWMLEGFDEKWSPVRDKTDADYSNIPPGSYTFLVRASNEDGVWSDPIGVSFSITPPFWWTWWFLSICTVLVLVSVRFIFRLRERRIKEEAEQEQQRLEFEKDIIRLEQKALRLQMNPHFIFNALNSIQGLIANQDDKTARYYLAKFSRLMRLTLENSRTQQIPLENEIKTLENYLSLEQFSSGDQFDYELKVNEELALEDTYIPPMMIQPFVENAIIHGLRHLAHRGHIHVNFTPVGKHLVISIEDNGIGREKASAIKSQRDQHHKSTALLVTQERLDILNANHGSIKSLEIEDITAADGTAAGTKVILRIPQTE